MRAKIWNPHRAGPALRGEVAEQGQALRGEVAKQGQALRGEMAAMERRLVAHIGAEIASHLSAYQEHLDLRLDLILEGQQVFVRRDELTELLEG